MLEAYYNTGKIVFCDNFFTSIRLEQYLRDRNLGLVGTWRRKRIPQYKKLTIPEKKSYICYKLKTQNNFSLTIWNDNKIVNIMNNAFPVTPWLKESRTQTKVIPSIINTYNQYKHGVDSNNQNTYHYRFPHKSNRWSKNVFFHLLQISMYNDFLIYKKKNNKISYNNFYESIIVSLLGSKQETKKSSKIHNFQYFDDLKKVRQRCVLCKNKKTSFCCTVCIDAPVYLCIPYCYNDYHKQLINK